MFPDLKKKNLKTYSWEQYNEQDLYFAMGNGSDVEK